MADLQFPNLGNALLQGSQAGYYAQKTRHEAGDEDRRLQAAPYIAPAMSGDQAALSKLASFDPKSFSIIAPRLAQMDADKRAKVKAAADYTYQASNALLQANPAERPAIWKQLLASGQQQGFELGHLPPEYSPAMEPLLRSWRTMAIGAKAQMEEEGKNQRHGSQAGGASGLEPMGGPPAAAPAPVTAPAARPGNPRVSMLTNPAGGSTGGFAPPDVVQATTPPVQVADAAPPPGIAQGQATAVPDTYGQQSPGPLRPEGVGIGAPPMGPSAAPPVKRLGPIVTQDPAENGYELAQDRKKPGQGVIVDGYIHYINPRNPRDVVLYKPGGASFEDVNDPTGKLIGQRNKTTNQYHPINQAAPGDEIDPTLRGDELLKSLNPAESAQVMAVVDGRAPLPSLSARMAPEAKRLRTLAFQYDPNFDATVYASRQKTQNDMADGKLAVQRTAANKLIAHIGDLHEVSAEINNSDTPLFNKVGNIISANRGDPRIAKFNVAKHLVLEEADKFFSGTGGTTVSGMEEMRKLINDAQSPQQLQGAMTQLEKMMKGQISAMADQYNNGMKYTGDKRIKADALLSDDARAGLLRIEANPLKGPAQRARDEFTAGQAPPAGTVEQGFRFRGGDPSKRENWEPAQ